MLARSGGDEFCIVLPSSSLREGAMIARRVLEVCRIDAEHCTGNDVPISVSIGVAQWGREIGALPELLIAAADQALYGRQEGAAATALRPSIRRRRWFPNRRTPRFRIWSRSSGRDTRH